MTRYERKAIALMQGYRYGEQPQTDAITKLNTNENPYPPSPKVAAALRDFDVAGLRRYPEATSRAFRVAAARLHHLQSEQIIATNGGDELLRLAVTTFVPPQGVIGSTSPSYSLYPVLAAVQEACLITEPIGPDYQLNEKLVMRMNAAKASLLLLVNPHSPSGCLTKVSTLDRIASAFEGVLLLDEAYVDFVNPAANYNALSLLKKHDNLLILRTLSKGYGLAGLRFAYGLGAPELIQPMMEKTKDSYNLDSLSQSLAEQALQDQNYSARVWAQVRAERSRVTKSLRILGWTVPDSEANFVLARCPERQAAAAHRHFKALKARHILVRYFQSPELADTLRITLGRPSENDLLMAALAEI